MGTSPRNSGNMNYHDQPEGGAILSGVILLAGVLGMMFLGLLDIWV